MLISGIFWNRIVIKLNHFGVKISVGYKDRYLVPILANNRLLISPALLTLYCTIKNGKAPHDWSGAVRRTLAAIIFFSPKHRNPPFFSSTMVSHLLDVPRDPDDCKLPPLHGGALDVELGGGGVRVSQLLQLGHQLCVVVVVG